MAYISNWLTHWVGRGKPEHEQYSILVDKILKDKRLLFRNNLIITNKDKPPKESVALCTSSGGGPIVPMICFTDIPFSECEKHCYHYSQFGLSFTKHYMVKNEASPVIYCLNPRVIISINNIAQLIRNIFIDYYREHNECPDYEGKMEISKRMRNHHLYSLYAKAEEGLHYLLGLLQNYSKSEIDQFSIGKVEGSVLEDITEDFFYSEEYPFYFEREWRLLYKPPTPSWRIMHPECSCDERSFYFSGDQVKYIIVPMKYHKDMLSRMNSLFADCDSLPTVLIYEDLKYL